MSYAPKIKSKNEKGSCIGDTCKQHEYILVFQKELKPYSEKPKGYLSKEKPIEDKMQNQHRDV